MLLCLLSCCVVFRCLLSPPSSAVSCRAVPSSRRFRHRQSGPAVCRALRESYRFDSSSRHGFAIPPDCSSLPPRYTQSCRFAAALMPTAQQFTHMSPVIQLLPGARRSVASRTLRRTAGTRFLLAYGDQDRTIPVEDQDTARRVISGTRGARLCMYPGMAHAICDREIDDIRDFLR